MAGSPTPEMSELALQLAANMAANGRLPAEKVVPTAEEFVTFLKQHRTTRTP